MIYIYIHIMLYNYLGFAQLDHLGANFGHDVAFPDHGVVDKIPHHHALYHEPLLYWKHVDIRVRLLHVCRPLKHRDAEFLTREKLYRNGGAFLRWCTYPLYSVGRSCIEAAYSTAGKDPPCDRLYIQISRNP